MTLPAELHRELEKRFGNIDRVEAVGGGCVSSSSRVEIEGESFFLKFESGAPQRFFEVEATGLDALERAASGVIIPSVKGQAENAGLSWILMQWLESAPRTAADEAELGRHLARLHRVRGEEWGWERDGYIGRLPQSNRRNEDWPTFWWEERLSPQLQMLEDRKPGGAKRWSELQDALPHLLARAETDGPSLLHGDLWSGNALYTENGGALIDPACYFGHREVDLAMTELFGGFGTDFYSGYSEEWPLLEGSEVRKRVYQLYYLLVHVNLFGAGYAARTESTLKSVLKAT